MTSRRRYRQSPIFLPVDRGSHRHRGDRLISLAIQPEPPGYSFAVNIEGRALSSFQEVSGLDIELEVIEYGTAPAARHGSCPARGNIRTSC